MGQKVNPVGARLGFNKDWTSHWFSEKGYATFLREDATIKGAIVKRYPRSSISSIQIFRNRGDIAVTIQTAKPGIIIGRSGAGAQELKALVEKGLMKIRKDGIRPNVRISIVEMKNPELSAAIVAETITGQIERRISVKRAMKQAVERTMEKKAKGIKIRISGRLGGAEIARSEIISNGSIPLQTIRSDISYALAEAHTTYGVIGVKVWINLGEADTVTFDGPAEQSSRNNKSR
jgi:small subunit ribosomal protein S3